MKHTIFKTLLLASSVIALSACSQSSTATKSSETPKTEKATKETKVKDKVEKDVTVLFDSTFAGKTKGFVTLYGKSFEKWTDAIYSESAKKFVVEQEYEPQSDWTMKYYDAELTPEEVYKHFLQTRRKMVQKIGSDYTIKDISIEEDTATVTVETRVLNLQQVALITRSIRSEIWGDDGELALGLSDDADLKKAVSLLSYYIFYANWSGKFLNLDKEFSAIPVSVTTHEFEMRLEKNDRGDWVVNEEDYNNFISETLTVVDDYDDWTDANGEVENEKAPVTNNL